MNFLKSVTSTVLSSTGVNFPFAIGERIPGIEAGGTIWDIRSGVKKDDGSPLTLFIFDSTLPPLNPGNRDRKTLLQLARNTLKKLRTIRHPDVIKYIDSVETDTHVYIATEPVRPLAAVIRDMDSSATAKIKEAKAAWMGWGLKSVSTALAFVNAPPLSQHHAYLIPSSVFVTPAMEWRLGGFDLLTGRDDAGGVLWNLGGVAPGNPADFSSPEVKKGGWGSLRETDPAQEDTYLLAMFLFWLYNSEKPLPNFSAAPTPASAGAIPKRLFPLWKRMLNPNAKTRLSTINFVAEVEITGFWKENPLVALVEGLDGFELRSDGEKQALLRKVKDAADAGSLPEPFLIHRVLPSLLHSLSLPNAPSALMLPLVLAIGKNVPPSTYPKVVLEPVVKLYASPDRGTRMALLDGLEMYSDKLDSRTVTERVWPNLITGFADTVPVIREATIKAVYPLASKLSDRILNNELLRLLAKMQTDAEPSIRTNTCILLGRLAPMLSTNTKKKVLVPAFARSLKDTFVHARVAGLMALMATVDCFDRDDLAARVIPNMAFTLVDKEKVVRDQAFKALNMFVRRLEEEVASMPATVLREEDNRSPNHVGSSPSPSPNGYPTATTTSSLGATVVTSAAGAAGSLAGWAFSSLSRGMASSEANASLTVQPSAAPGMSGDTGPTTSRRTSDDSVSASFASRPAASSRISSFSGTRPASATRSSGGGMKLGGAAKKSASATNAALAETLSAEFDDFEDGDEVTNAWGNDDLIDVNADDDDWSAFEAAPSIVAPEPQKAPQSYYVTPTPAPAPAPPSPRKERVPVAPAAPVAPQPVKAAFAVPPKAPASPRSSFSASEQSMSKPSTPAPTAAPSLAGMSKEEKEKEMARRREERKARIAAMKDSKKK